MICTCCGRWRINAIWLQTDSRRPPVQRLRVTWGQYYIGDYAHPGELRDLNIPLANFTNS
jgi:hypothetical protein